MSTDVRTLRLNPSSGDFWGATQLLSTHVPQISTQEREQLVIADLIRPRERAYQVVLRAV